MPTVLDNFIVLFGESGAKKLEKTIDNIGKAVVNSVNKSIAAHKTLERHRSKSNKNLTNANKLRHKLATESSKIEERTLRKTVPLEKQLDVALGKRERLEKSIAGLSKNTIKYQQKRNELAKENAKIVDLQEKKSKKDEKEKIAQDKEREKAERAAMLARTSNIRKIASFFGLSRGAMLAGGLGAGILGAGMLAKGTWDFTKGKVHSRVKNALSYIGTGTEPKYAVGLDKELYGYGGEKGEAIQLLSQLSAGIGSMRYGDTSLVQTLGTFGISGIGAHSKSKDILRSVWQRAQGMDEEEREAMFNALGFSQGVKNFMRKGSLSEIDLDAAVSKWEEDDSEILKGMYDVENTIQKKVEEIASGVGKIVKWLEDFFGKDKGGKTNYNGRNLIEQSYKDIEDKLRQMEAMRNRTSSNEEHIDNSQTNSNNTTTITHINNYGTDSVGGGGTTMTMETGY